MRDTRKKNKSSNNNTVPFINISERDSMIHRKIRKIKMKVRIIVIVRAKLNHRQRKDERKNDRKSITVAEANFTFRYTANLIIETR